MEQGGRVQRITIERTQRLRVGRVKELLVLEFVNA
jgi:uncharacterized glyoxalase superfamily metalloenzyme YdcJ